MDERIISRFWPKVDKRDAASCWEWTAALSSKGYGVMCVPGDRSKRLYAHRVSIELATGLAPGDLFVCHRCDNPKCVNPSHLFLGDQGANMRDMASKGRGVATVGEAQWCAKLTESQVIEIRRLRALGYSSPRLGRMFGVVHSHILRICNGVKWKQLIG